MPESGRLYRLIASKVKSEENKYVHLYDIILPVSRLT